LSDDAGNQGDEMNHPVSDKLVQAYNRMMERVRQALEGAESSAIPAIRHGIDKARETAVELEELSHDEAEKISYYLKRDLQDAGKHLAETGDELGDWLRFDIDRIEDRLLDIFSRVADQTRIEWAELQQELKKDPPYHSGEVTGPGSLYCSSCNEALHFHHTSRIPVCPNCANETFRRWPVQDRGSSD
jgi:hypothetical protein